MSNEIPLACDLTAIEDEELEIHKTNGLNVFESVKEFKELSGGYAFRLPADTDIIEHTGGFIARERLCCPFFNFSLELTSDHGPVWLNITGDENVKEYIKMNIVAQLQEK